MEQTLDNYELCYKNLCSELIKLDPKVIAHNCDISYDEEGKFFITEFLHRKVKIDYPSGVISILDKDNPPKVDYLDLSVMERILVISFLLRCSPGPLTDKWVPLRELQGVGYAYDKFASDSIETFVEYFTGKEDLLSDVGRVMGAAKDSRGDVAIKIEVLPKVPLLLVLWRGDEEFPTRANVLFDYSATGKLHVEDLAGLGGLVIREVIYIAKNL